ncbi:MAG: putative flavoprotein involved in transport, partial [Solirubrobacteraceae bacterium]|nr:putative flavoprotein involved in transport [Solirubrobacteraceae bacterium]
GLALAHQLQQHGLAFLVLDAAAEIGNTWRSRWDSLTLFTSARYSSLPGMAFPAEPDSYPTKDAVADYLRGYVDEFRLPVQLDTAVTALTRTEDLFTVHTGRGLFLARQVVVATGPFQVPVIPAISCAFGPDIVQLHSSGYRNPAQLAPGPVLVVGGANSGVQIAAELCATRPVHLAVGSSLTQVPKRLLGKDLFWWLTRLGMFSAPADSRLGRKFRARGDLLIGSSLRQLRRAGVQLHGRLARADEATAHFADGGQASPATVIWATGFRADYSWIQIPGITSDGRVAHDRGASPVPGLHFLGLPWQHTRGSALLGFVGADAAYTANRIAGTRASYVAVDLPASAVTVHSANEVPAAQAGVAIVLWGVIGNVGSIRLAWLTATAVVVTTTVLLAPVRTRPTESV